MRHCVAKETYKRAFYILVIGAFPAKSAANSMLKIIIRDTNAVILIRISFISKERLLKDQISMEISVLFGLYTR